MPQVFSIGSWGGSNHRDQPEELIERSHVLGQGGWSPRVLASGKPVGTESPDQFNTDFHEKGLQKRLGSASYVDLSASIPAGDSIVATLDTVRYDGSSLEFAVTTTTIMANVAAAGWAQLNATTGASVFTFADSVANASIVPHDGHHFFFTDGASNYAQVYRTGTAIDPQMASGSAYTDAFGTATSHALTGAWQKGSHIACVVQSRLAWIEEGLLVQFTPMAHTSDSGVWDLTGAGAGAFHLTGGEGRFMTSFVPKGGNEVTDEQLMIGTSGGIESTTGFEDYDRLNVEHGSEGVLNHKAFCKTENWVVYLTRNRNLHAYNGAQVIDLGARLRSKEGDGPLDNMHIATSETTAFGVYDPNKRQAQFWFSTSTARVNDSAVVVDFKDGEPMPFEPADSWERRVKVVPWQIGSPDSNDWFICAHTRAGSVIGAKEDGTLWTTDSGLDDLGSIAIAARWKSPVMTGGAPFVTLQKQWLRLRLRTEQTGDWELTINEYHDRDVDVAKTWQMTLVNSGTPLVGSAVVPFALTAGGDVRAFNRVDRRSEAFQFELTQAGSTEDFLVTHADVTYEIGGQVN
jgi:hypothetical protein